MNNNEINIRGNEIIKKKQRYVTKYYETATNIFEQLNKIGPGFCLAKWYNVSIHIPTGQTHSCYHPKSHHIPIKEIKIDVSALHNTKFKKEVRKEMLEGKRPSECHFCWEIEDSGNQLSDRAYRSQDVWDENAISEIIELGYNGNPKPKYVEVNFNQACNFKCSYCSPHLSTEWMKEIQNHGPYTLIDHTHNDLNWMKQHNVWPDNSPDNPYLNAFWKWWPTIYPTLKTFRMTGGEPLMDKNTFKIFDYIKENPKDDLHLSITSNCCPPKNQWKKFIKGLNEITDKNQIEHFMLFCSLDSWGEQAEYIRRGMNFDILNKNIREFLKQPNDKHSLSFICTFNVLSYSNWNEYIKNILELRREFNTTRQLVWFDIPQLHYPHWLNPKLLPEMIYVLEDSLEFMENNKETFNTAFKGFKDYEISKVKRLIDWIKSPIDFNKDTAMANFYAFWKESDKRLNTDFLTVFPTLENFWNKCKEKYNDAKLHG